LSFRLSSTLSESKIADIITPSSRKNVYIIRVVTELRHDGQQAQQQLTAVEPQQHASYNKVKQSHEVDIHALGHIAII
jgi:hypothetical protein